VSLKADWTVTAILFLRASILVAGLILALGEGSPAAEKKFPAKPVQVIIPFQPGSTDVLLRPFVEKMPEFLGQPVPYIYKPGAAGSLGAGFVAASKPDGYTLLGTSNSSIVTVPLTQKDLTYNSKLESDLRSFLARREENPGEPDPLKSAGTRGQHSPCRDGG